jgi:cytochrome c oxidase cbb3-type subunit 3
VTLDINEARTVVTVLGLVCFIAITLWAYSGRARKGFDEAALLPFSEDDLPARRVGKPRKEIKMADFVSGFWNAYVMVLVFLSIAFCVFVLVSNNKARTSGPVGLHDHIWDETLQEYNNPLPRWWMYMFWITIIFAISYLAMYPGFGNNQGKLGWSSGGQWEAEQKAAAEKYGPIFAKFRTMDLNAVAGDKEANAMGQRLFLTYCAQCHGADAKGAKGFPNLTDSDWLYGGEPETIKTTLSAAVRA